MLALCLNKIIYFNMWEIVSCFYLCAGEALLVVGGLLGHLLLSLEDAPLAPEKRQKNQAC